MRRSCLALCILSASAVVAAAQAPAAGQPVVRMEALKATCLAAMDDQFRLQPGTVARERMTYRNMPGVVYAWHECLRRKIAVARG